MIKARKIYVLVNDEICEAVEFYDTSTNQNVDPTKSGLTNEEVIEMSKQAFGD